MSSRIRIVHVVEHIAQIARRPQSSGHGGISSQASETAPETPGSQNRAGGSTALLRHAARDYPEICPEIVPWRGRSASSQSAPRSHSAHPATAAPPAAECLRRCRGTIRPGPRSIAVCAVRVELVDLTSLRRKLVKRIGAQHMDAVDDPPQPRVPNIASTSPRAADGVITS